MGSIKAIFIYLRLYVGKVARQKCTRACARTGIKFSNGCEQAQEAGCGAARVWPRRSLRRLRLRPLGPRPGTDCGSLCTSALDARECMHAVLQRILSHVLFILTHYTYIYKHDFTKDK